MRTLAIMMLVLAVVLAGCKGKKNTQSPAGTTAPATQIAQADGLDLLPVDQPGKFGQLGRSTASKPTSLPTAANTTKIAALIATNTQLQSQLTDAQKQLDDARESLKQSDSDARDAIAGMQARIDLLEGDNQAMRKALDLLAAAGSGQASTQGSLAIQLNDAAINMDKLNQENQRLRDARKADRDQLASVFEELEQTRQVLTANNNNAQDAINRLQGENQQLAATNDALMQGLDRARIGGRDPGRTSTMSQLEEARKTIARLNEDNKHLADQLAQATDQNNQHDTDTRRLASDLADRDKLIRDLQKKSASNDRPNTDVLKQLAERDKRIGELIVQVAQQEMLVKDLQKKLADQGYKPDHPDKPTISTPITPVPTVTTRPIQPPPAIVPVKPVKPDPVKTIQPDRTTRPDQTDRPDKAVPAAPTPTKPNKPDNTTKADKTDHPDKVAPITPPAAPSTPPPPTPPVPPAPTTPPAQPAGPPVAPTPTTPSAPPTTPTPTPAPSTSTVTPRR